MLFEIEKVNFEFYIVGTSIGFFVTGYFLGQRTISLKMCLLCLISFLILAIAITGVGFEISVTENMRRHLANGHLRIPLALLFFVVLKYVGETEVYRQYLSARVSRLAPLTFGIYLVHSLIVHAFVGGLFGFKFSIETFAPWFSIPLMAAVVYTASAVMVWLLQRIPFARWILP
jgi:surface polysaccharide O-acyltransferase-like enzyme